MSIPPTSDGPPTQGWSKFASKFNFPSSSNAGGKPWKMPANLEKAVDEAENEIRMEKIAIKHETKYLEKLRDQVHEKQRWIRQKESEIKVQCQWIRNSMEGAEKEEAEIRKKVRKANSKNNWVLGEKAKFPLDFPECNEN